MAVSRSESDSNAVLPPEVRAFLDRRLREALGLLCLLAGLAVVVSIAGYNAADPSLNTATDGPVANLLGYPGAVIADLSLQYLGIASFLLALALAAWGIRLMRSHELRRWWLRLALLLPALLLLGAAADAMAAPADWPPATGLGGALGALAARGLNGLFGLFGVAPGLVALGALVAALALCPALLAMRREEFAATGRALKWLAPRGGHAAQEDEEPGGPAIETRARKRKPAKERRTPRFSLPKLAMPRLSLPGTGGKQADADEAPARRSRERIEPVLADIPERAPTRDTAAEPEDFDLPEPEAPAREPRRSDIVEPRAPRAQPGKRAREAAQSKLALDPGAFELPPLELLAEPSIVDAREAIDEEALAQNARLLESVLNDFNVKGEVVRVRPGPVVTLYELEPAPGTKSSRIINLADDIARSMSAISVRVATVPGRNVIGIELPNQQREGVLLRELLAARAFESTKQDIPIVLGKDIGGEAVIADLARMPHLLIAGTTGSGKSVALNTMILSLLYRSTPAQLKLIMIDPKMLELSVYGDIPHLLTPVVTEPKKAVVALKWAVKEMEDRYRAMSALGVRNIHGYNERIAQAIRKKETLTRKVPVGIDPETGRQIIEEQPIDPAPLPFIVVVVDEMADLMLVAGKDIEAAIQRLAQMARAAGIHLIMATQRPSVDVITGTIKANFPTRISFQVTSKIDSPTILGEQGAEQLLGQGDMLYMAGGGRIRRVHGPFVSDEEVEQIVDHLRAQGLPHYIEEVTYEPEEGGFGEADEGGDDLYAQAVDVVRREGKASTSFIQRKLQIGYNRAARIIEQMEERGIVSEANHVGKREVLAPPLDGPGD